MKMKQHRLALLISSLLLGSTGTFTPSVLAAPVQAIRTFPSSEQAASALIQDPQAFIERYTLDTMIISSQESLGGLAWARLEPARDGYRVRYVASNEPGTVPSYFLGFNGASNPAPAYVDIPAKVPEGTLLMTGTLSGCSVIVTERDGGFRVFHDGRVGSSLLYDKVVMKADYHDYASPNEEHRYGAAFMIFKEGRWQLLIQKQQHVRQGDGVADAWYAKREGDEGAPLVMQAGRPESSEVVTTKLAQFEHNRQAARNALIELGKSLNLVEFPKDHPFNAADPMPKGNSTAHPSLSDWNNFRQKVEQALRETGGVAELNRQILALRAEPHSFLNQQKLVALKITKDFLSSLNLQVLDRWKNEESLWLWLQRKHALGTDAAVAIDGNLASGQDSRFYDRFVSMKRVLDNFTGSRREQYRQGLDHSEQIIITGLVEGAGLQVMLRRFFDEQHPLTLTQKGALTARIEARWQQKYRQQVLDTTLKVKHSFEDSGGRVVQLMPQDLLLNGSSGRCLPLSRAMSVALAVNGEAGVTALAKEIYEAAAMPGGEFGVRVFSALASLHSNSTAISAETALGQQTLDTLVNTLDKASEGTFFVIDTKIHSMLVGKSMEKGSLPTYYFYDPNFAVVKFENIKAFRKGLESHFVKNGFGKYYQAYGKNSFAVRLVDTQAMAAVPLTGGLTSVAELALPAGRSEQYVAQQVAGTAAEINDALARDTLLKSNLYTFESLNLAEGYHNAIGDLYSRNTVQPDWVPLLESMTEEDTGSYTLPFMKPDGSLKLIDTQDVRVWRFRNRYQEILSHIKGTYTFEKGRLLLRSGIEQVEHVDGLNAAFAAQSIMGLLRAHDAARPAMTPQLSQALAVHTYVNLAQLAHGAVMDTAKVVALYKVAMNEAKPLVNGSVTAIGHAANEGAGLLFGIANVGLDAFELSQASNEVEKATFGTQLAFDSASLAMSAAGAGAGVMGASTAGAFLGGAGVIVAGLGVGFSALAQGFGAVAEDAKAVGRYFEQIDKAYQRGGYEIRTLAGEQSILAPLDGAVINQLDLVSHELTFGSQYLYRTHHGPTGSGNINYFFWVGDMPRIVRDKAQALDIRDELKYAKTASLPVGEQPLLLPATPRSYISYEYLALPGATTRHDPGFNVLRRLEGKGTFDYDFYVFPSEFTVRRITQQYEPTDVTVRLDSHDRLVLMRELADELKGVLHYALHGDGGQYQVVLRSGATLALHGTGGRWQLDARQLDKAYITLKERNLTVGDITISLDGVDMGEVLVILPEEAYRVDLATNEVTLVREDGNKWQDTDALRAHLDDLSREPHLGSHYVVVDNYHPNGLNGPVGRAFYETKTRRFIYTRRPDAAAWLAQAELVAVQGEDAWFSAANSLWRIEIATGEVLSQYRPFGDGRITHARFWQEGAHLYWEQVEEQGSGEIVLRTYLVEPSRLSLVNINGDETLLEALVKGASLDRKDKAAALLGQPSWQAPSQDLDAHEQVQAEFGHLVTVSGKLSGANQRVWVNPNAPLPEGVIRPNLAQPLPEDLLFAGRLPTDSPEREVFYFYSHKANKLYLQRGQSGIASDLIVPGLSSVLSDGGQVFALTKEGVVYLQDREGSSVLAALNRQWLEVNRNKLSDALAKAAGNNPSLDGVALLGLTNSDKQVVSAWYDVALQRVIQANKALDGRRLSYLGVSPDEQYAWLIDNDAGILYRQPIPQHVSDFLVPASLEVASVETHPEAFLTLRDGVQSARRIGNTLRIVSGGCVLELPMNASLGTPATLVAVSDTWLASQSKDLEHAFGSWRQDVELAPAIRLGEASVNWYLSNQRHELSGKGLSSRHVYEYLGQESDGEMHYVVDRSTSKLLVLDALGHIPARTLGAFSWSRLEGNMLSLIAAKGADDHITLPRLAKATSVQVAAHGKRPVFMIGKQDRAHYRRISIDDQSNLSQINLQDTELTSLLVQRLGAQLVIYDRNHPSVLLVKLHEDGLGPTLVLNTQRIELASVMEQLKTLPMSSSILALSSLVSKS